MSIIPSNRFLKVLNREPVDRTPIWLMRQAGRYLPEYREVRGFAGSFLNLCQNPELACAVTLQPLERYPLDAAIIFSDILTVPHAMGCGLYFSEGEGPKFERPISSAKDIAQLPVPCPETELKYVMDAIRLTHKTLAGRIPLIGFCGSPWTVATYMVEGGASKTFSKIKKMMYSAPDLLHDLLTKVTEASINYLIAQIKAGAQTVMIFDSWGGVLSAPCYEAFSLNYMHKIVNALKRNGETSEVPIILFTKNGGQWLELMAKAPCQALGLDWTQCLADARHRVGDKVVLQGNCDPAILLSTPEVIQQEVARTLAAFGANGGHIFNLGHGMLPEADPENVAALIEAVIKFSPAYHDASIKEASI